MECGHVHLRHPGVRCSGVAVRRCRVRYGSCYLYTVDPVLCASSEWFSLRTCESRDRGGE
jgi:hypothetical protein